MAGVGYVEADIDAKVGALARQACAFKAEAADMRVWFDRLHDGTDQQCADALAAASGMANAKALLTVQAVREFTFWAASFAPTYTTDVRGPSSLI